MLHPSRRLASGLIVAFLAIVVGCNQGPALPKTHSATGTVVYQGGQPMKGGSLQFNSAADPLLRVVGEIKDDGTFTLRTVKEGSFTTGAPEGDYQVIVTPALVKDPASGLPFAHHGVPPITLPTSIKLEAKENVLRLELPDPPPAS